MASAEWKRNIRLKMLEVWGSDCWLCKDPIDLSLEYPDPWCFTKDHVIPRSKGGKERLSNLRPAHNRCNSKRGNADVNVRRGLNVF